MPKSQRLPEDEESAIQREASSRKSAGAASDVSPEEPRIGFHAYLLLCLVAAALPVVLTVALWSQMGMGEACMKFLDERQSLAKFCAGAVAVLLVVLYLLDFFCPPHMPGEFLQLFENDPCIRFIIMGLLGIGMLGVGLLVSKDYPYLPTLITTLCGPVLMGAVRHATRPRRRPPVVRKTMKPKQAMQLLADMVSEELDCRTFYSGAMVAFVLTGVLDVLVWILWTMSAELDRSLELGNLEQERRYIRYLAPLIVGLANLSFGFIAMLRVMLGDDYHDADNVRVDLICKVEDIDCDRLDSMEAVVARSLKSAGTMEVFKQLSEKDQRLLVREEIHKMMRVLKTMKVIGCCLLTLLGCLYVAAELVAADSHLAELVLGFVGVCFLCFVAFLFAAFGRLVSSTKDWFLDCPLGRLMLAVSESDWLRAIVLCGTLPAIPALLALSMLNQLVRKGRGLYTRIPPRQVSAFDLRTSGMPSGATGTRDSKCTITHEPIEIDWAPQDQLLTERFMVQIEAVRRWDWVSVVSKTYIVNLLFFLYILSPRLLNVGLSWLSTLLLNGVPFGTTIAITVASGLTCFLLPPVPGLPVYIFTGIIVSKVCPWGYWPGCGVAIGSAFLMKLMACAMQQKLIGEALGSSIWIRSQVGVNKPFFRAVERILRQPGLNWGKVAILCGGPDWPTSVLTGILHCPLLQMELGTFPIIIFIVPCTLCGCFYVKKVESQRWQSGMNIMVALSVAINMVFGIGALWAVQEELDTNHWEVTKPMEEYIDLDWLDYRSAQIAASCVIQWRDVQCCVRVLALMGACLEIACSHSLYWFSKSCFGKFEITDDINALVWFGKAGLFKLPGVLGLNLGVLGFVGYVVLVIFIRRKQAMPAALKMKRLEAFEETWKAERSIQASKAKKAPQRSPAEVLRAGNGKQSHAKRLPRGCSTAASVREIAKE